MRPSSTVRRSSAVRNTSPSKRNKSKVPVEDDGSRGPDPSEFEAAFVIDDDSEAPTRVSSPALPVMDEKASEKAATEQPEEVNGGAAEKAPAGPPKPAELSQDVKTKLRKLEKLEARYAGMVTFKVKPY